MRYFFILVYLGLALSQTTGKISGYVIDAESNDPIIGANIVVKGTSLGTASDEDGIFYIINLSPGSYTVECSVIGYENNVNLLNQLSLNPNNILNFIPERSKDAFLLYQKHFL